MQQVRCYRKHGTMGKRLYSIDYQGHASRDRRAERASKPAGSGWTGKILLMLAVLAVLMVIASVLAPAH